MEATGMKKFQIPTTNIQTISKFQVSNPVSGCLVIGVFLEFGCWNFGIFHQPIGESQISKL
jgi:hypothetical protein